MSDLENNSYLQLGLINRMEVIIQVFHSGGVEVPKSFESWDIPELSSGISAAIVWKSLHLFVYLQRRFYQQFYNK